MIDSQGSKEQANTATAAGAEELWQADEERNETDLLDFFNF